VSGIWLAFIGLFLGQAARSAELQTTISDRIEGLRVADVMDAEPVAVPEDLSLDRAEEEFFLRYHDWPWFPVVDATGHLVGVVTRQAVESVPEAVRPSRPVASVMARDDGASGLRVDMESPLEAVLASDGLSRLGALLAVDRDGILRGVVTANRVRRTLRPATP
jgi:CBS-domain-containing membrane protein